MFWWAILEVLQKVYSTSSRNCIHFLLARYSDLAVYKLHLVEIAKNMPVEYLLMVLFQARQSLTAPLLLLLRMLSN